MDKQLEQIVIKLREGRQMQTSAWDEVLREARQYAQVKLHTSYIENGRVIQLNRRDSDAYVNMIRDNLLRACERAFLEDALMGATLQQAINGS
jgi:hypothetical protein